MKKILYSVLSLTFMVLVFTSCDQNYTDFNAADARDRRDSKSHEVYSIQLGGTTNFDITIDIPQGPGIVSVEIYRTIQEKQQRFSSQTVSVASANAAEDKSIKVSYNYKIDSWPQHAC